MEDREINDKLKKERRKIKVNGGRKINNGEVRKTEIVTAISIAMILDKKSIKITEEESRRK